MRLVAWLVGLLTAHTAVNAGLLRTPLPGPVTRSVSVLLPVRDEAAVVQRCVRALQAQTLPVELLVLDDGSTDGTGDLLRELGVEPLTSEELPPGWIGKAHACAQLAAASTGDVLVFVDADTVLVPHAVEAAVALLEQTGLDLVSPVVRHLAPGSLRLVQPLLSWSWLTFLPLRLAEHGSPSLAAANGAFLGVHRSAYDRAGGHHAVRDEVVEDVELLRAVKRTGGSGGMVDGTALASCQMYGTWAELVRGYDKSLHTVPLPALLALAVLYVLPPVAALRGSRAGATATALGVAGRAVTARRTRSPLVDAVAHPVSVSALLGLAAHSRWTRSRGGTTWKGRPV